MSSLFAQKYPKDVLTASLFRQALDPDRNRGCKRPKMRSLSYYAPSCKIETAMESLERGLRLSPNDGVPRSKLSNVNCRLGVVSPFHSRSDLFNRWLGKLRRRHFAGLDARLAFE